MRIFPLQQWARGVRLMLCALALALAVPASADSRAAEALDIGLAGSGERIDALLVRSTARKAPTVVLIGGVAGDDASARAVRETVAWQQRQPHRGFTLLAVPVANPGHAALQFPPTGIAYRENPESHVLWRWLGAQAPDLVLVAGGDA